MTGQPDERHEKLPAYYHAPTKTWVIRCSCGWRVREWEGTHEQHLIETSQGKRK